MIKEIELAVSPADVENYDRIKKDSALKLKLNVNEITAVQVVRRSIDARKKEPVYRLKVNVYVNEELRSLFNPVNYKPVATDKTVYIAGSGPAGLFAALRLIELNIRPVILERGKDVQSRRKDLRNIQQEGLVNPDSNYCFGEGGAGTYSDGKLYTRSTKRGDVGKILSVLVQHGAVNDILIDAHPHIGSNKLPKIIQEMRETIISCGGEVRFGSKLTGLTVKNDEIRSVIINDREEIPAEALILATGHSARDIYYLLHKQGLLLEAKPFAVGVRIEHPQPLIDSIQYHQKVRPENLPASSYSLTCRVDDKGVYSFCMCPGGIIIPASTSQDELVLNGMSVSRRDSPYANSGFVTEVNENDWVKFKEHGLFAGLEYQASIENAAFEAGGKTQRSPAQRVTDFLKGKTSASLPGTSYIPGAVSYPLDEIFPSGVVKRLKDSLHIFNKKMRGYITEEAQMLAAETRTSSPIRIPRDKETYMHAQCKGLFPSGEGAGYAGGIISAAIDGENCANACASYINIS